MFFNWEMTVRVRPAEHPPMPITESDQGSAIARMKRVGQHFHDAANLHEYGMEFETLRADPGRAMPLKFVPREADSR